MQVEIRDPCVAVEGKSGIGAVRRGEFRPKVQPLAPAVGAAKVHFATITANLAVTNADFFVF